MKERGSGEGELGLHVIDPSTFPPVPSASSLSFRRGFLVLEHDEVVAGRRADQQQNTFLERLFLHGLLEIADAVDRSIADFEDHHALLQSRLGGDAVFHDRRNQNARRRAARSGASRRSRA